MSVLGGWDSYSWPRTPEPGRRPLGALGWDVLARCGQEYE